MKELITKSIQNKEGETLVEGLVSLVILSILVLAISTLVMISIRMVSITYVKEMKFQNEVLNKVYVDDYPIISNQKLTITIGENWIYEIPVYIYNDNEILAFRLE